MSADSFMAAARRLVIGLAVWLLWVAGAIVGAVAGFAYYDASTKAGASIVVAVLVGVGSALGSWLIAALLGLLVEMADSLQRIVRLNEITLELARHD